MNTYISESAKKSFLQVALNQAVTELNSNNVELIKKRAMEIFKGNGHSISFLAKQEVYKNYFG